jgi:hypothetical protein
MMGKFFVEEGYGRKTFSLTDEGFGQYWENFSSTLSLLNLHHYWEDFITH